MNYEDWQKRREREALIRFGQEMFAAHRALIARMTDAEYAAYKQRQAERFANA